jgi:GTP-binding protein Era
MNAAMVRDATDALANADLVLWVVDASERPGEGEDFTLGLLAKAGRPVVLALNKIDIVRKESLLPRIAQLAARHAFREVVPISALTGDGVDRLRDLLAGALPERPAAYPEDFLTSTPESEWISEVIREKLLERTRQELPFATAVIVDAVREEPAKQMTVVTASVVVEKESQKGIVIGKGASMIRDIGQAAREELERESGRRYFLDLSVTVRARWRDDERFLSRVVSDAGGGGRPRPHRRSRR